MSSPVEMRFFEQLVLDRESSKSLYIQLSDQIVLGIRSGVLGEGLKLPGSRAFAEILKLHRKTILAAFEELEQQGWIEFRPNVGTFVRRNSERQTSKPSIVHINRDVIRFKKSAFLDSPFESHTCLLAFNDGQPDYRLTPMEELTRMYRSATKRRKITRKLSDQQWKGSGFFKEQLTQQINQVRGISCSKNQVLVARSNELLLYIIGQLLLEKDSLVLVGNPSYFAANMIFQQAGTRLKTIPVDDEGIQTEIIERLFKPGEISLIYLNAQQHYPTTAVLSKARRAKLLELAETMDFVIVEDDVDYELNYDRQAFEPLAAEDKSGRVLYVGSFGRSLVPTFKTGFLVAGQRFIAEALNYLGILDRQSDAILEQALGEMLESGDWQRQWKKSVQLYKERRNKCVVLVNQHFGSTVKFQIPKGGLAIWIEFKKPISLSKLAQRCKEKELFIPRICLYQNQQLTALRLGFGHLSLTEMEAAFEILKNVYFELIGEE